MTNEDISFILPTDYANNGNNYYKREYIYDFSFHFYVNTLDSIKSVEIYKNGKKYDNVVVNNLETGYYFVKDMNVVPKGNYHYGVVVTLNDNKVYKNGFYLKILNSYIENDIKIVHFSTQGTHENFNALNVLLKIDSKYDIHSITLYRKFLNEEWENLGQMSQGNYGYIYKDLLFDVRMTFESTCKYKVKILASNGMTKEAEMEVPVYMPTFSLNTIFYNGNPPVNYSIYGGLVGTIISPMTEFNDEIFELIVDSGKKGLVSIDLKNKKYRFYSENFKISYPENFITSQSDETKNVFSLSGQGLVKQIISEEYGIVKKDACVFDMTIKCGNSFSVIFSIKPKNDYSLALQTEETLNNIVRYKDEYYNAEYKYDDKTISNNRTLGILIYSDSFKLLEMPNRNELNITVDMPQISALFEESNYATYNNSNFYFISYSNRGILLTAFDGINYDENFFELNIYEPTLLYLKENPCFKLDENNKIKFEFINYDLTKNFEIVCIQDNQLRIISCNENVGIIFNELRAELLAKLNSMYSYEEDGETYNVVFNRNFLLKEQTFNTMHFENFVQDMYMYEFVIAISSKADVNGLEKDCILSVRATVNIGINFYDIEKKDFNYIIGDYDSSIRTYNQKPINIMESLNDGYYIKFDSSLKTDSKDNYGHYTKCSLYKRNELLYNLNFSDVDEDKYFVYENLCKSRVVEIDSSNYLLLTGKNGVYIANHIDTARSRIVQKFILESSILPQLLLNLSEEQLRKFSNILSISKQNEFVDRKMRIFSLSDSGNVVMYQSGKEIGFNLAPASFSNINYYNSFWYEYNVKYPLNIKNKNAFLQEPEIESK